MYLLILQVRQQLDISPSDKEWFPSISTNTHKQMSAVQAGLSKTSLTVLPNKTPKITVVERTKRIRINRVPKTQISNVHEARLLTHEQHTYG